MTMDERSIDNIEAGQPWEVCRFQPGDAEGVVRLFRLGYGEGYPIRTYMEPAMLIRENEALRVISSVAKTPRGDVVGHTSLYNSAPHAGVYESGAALIHPAYRGSFKLYPKLILHSLELSKTLPEVEAVFGEMVCSHTTSQKMSTKSGSVFTALEPDLMPAEAYETEGKVTGRVAAVLSFKIYRQAPQQVYLPRSYAGELPFFYEGVDQDRRFAVSETGSPAGSISDITHQVFDFARVARIAVRSVGSDFSESLKTLEKALREKGILVYQVWLNLADQSNGEGVDILRKDGYFLGGVLPLWFGTDGLLMQKILKAPDWEGIRLHAERSERILEKVKADWERSIQDQSVDC